MRIPSLRWQNKKGLGMIKHHKTLKKGLKKPRKKKGRTKTILKKNGVAQPPLATPLKRVL